MDTIRRAALAALASGTLLLLGFSPGVANAQAGGHPQIGTAPTAISIGAPTSAEIGKPVTLQAVLVDGAGHPISGGRILFSSPAAFLNRSGDITVAEAITGEDGRAIVQYEARDSGPVTLRAEFAGDLHHAPATAAADIAVAGDSQLYSEHIGVGIPGLNEPPLPGSMLSAQANGPGLTPLIVALWPAMTGWPIAAALIIVWSLYAFAVSLIRRVARAASASDGEPEHGHMRIPLGLAAVVATFALTLLTIGARSPYTHANFVRGFDPHYSRTDQTFVGPAIPYMGAGPAKALPPASDPVARGKAMFVDSGCAACHGIEGRGGWVPPIVGTDAETLLTKARKGPGGMPAQPAHQLSDEDFTDVAAYLKSMSR